MKDLESVTKKLSIPKKMKILSETYDVIEKEVIEDGQILFGQVDHVNNKIYIWSKASEDKKRVTLIHETLHALFEQLGFSEEHDNEHLIKSLSVSLYSVLLENKDLFTFLRSSGLR